MAKLFRRIFLGDIGTKLTALFMAGTLWTYAYFSSLRRETDVTIPLDIRAPSGWAVIEKTPASLKQVTLVYPTHAANDVKRALSRGEIRAVYRVGTEPQDELIKAFTDVQLQPGNFVSTVAPGLRITTEETASFRIAKQETRRLPVELNLSDPPTGYRLNSKWWYPREAEVKGPAAALEKVDSILTKPVSVSPPPEEGVPIQRSVSVQDYVEVGGERYEISCDERIDYILYVSRELGKREFQNVPISSEIRPVNYPYEVRKITPQQMTVIIRGPQNELDALGLEDLVLSVDVRNLVPKSTPQTADVVYDIRDVPDATLFQVELEETQVAVDIQERAAE